MLGRMLRNEQGTVAVEFALVLPVLLLLVFAITELGSAWYERQMLVNASREGARMGALMGEDTTNADVETFVATLLTQAGFPGQITAICTGADGDPGDLVTVRVNSPRTMPVLGSMVPGVPSTITLTASTVMRHE